MNSENLQFKKLRTQPEYEESCWNWRPTVLKCSSTYLYVRKSGTISQYGDPDSAYQVLLMWRKSEMKRIIILEMKWTAFLKKKKTFLE